VEDVTEERAEAAGPASPAPESPAPEPAPAPPEAPTPSPEAAPAEKPKRARKRRRDAELPTRFQRGTPGARPGIDLAELAAMPKWRKPAPVQVIDYGPDRFEQRPIKDLDAFVAARREDWVTVRWINVDGLDPAVVRALAIKYGIHPLAIEDLIATHQRPKLETWAKEEGREASLFVIVRMIQRIEGQLRSEQISIWVNENTVLTFQEDPGDIWDPIRRRIATAGSRMRQLDASYLLYALLDAIVDHCFPVLEYYGDRLEELEDLVIDRPDPKVIQPIHELKRDLLLLRRAVWPMREVINGLQREPHECVSETTRTYLRDVYDHSVQIMDIVETYREVAASLTENYMTSMSNRLAEVMKVLTIIGTIFIPLTFLAGVYGMNMPIPENSKEWAYPVFWIICLVLSGGMLYWFRKRGWI
jgi:magnesium transporter